MLYCELFNSIEVQKMTVGTQQQGLLRYEERVRLERANGLREPHPCEPCHNGCNPHGNDAWMAGMTYADLANTPLKQNAVCPHTKVIVPVKPAMVIEEPVKKVTATYPAAGYRVVDMNPCDGRTQMLKTIPHGVDTEIKHASTVETHSTKVEDTLYDVPNEVRTVTRSVETNDAVEQPIAVGGTEAVNQITKDGKAKSKKNPQTEVVAETEAGSE